MDTQDEMLTIRCWSNNHTGTGNRRDGEFRVDPWFWNGLSESQRRKEVQAYLADNDHFQWGYVDPEADA